MVSNVVTYLLLSSIFLFAYAFRGMMVPLKTDEAVAEAPPATNTAPETKPEKDWDDRQNVKDLIATLAAAYGVNQRDALRIAECESGFQYQIKNKNSSALGVYQWTQRTWEHIGNPGDRANPEDNVRAFMEHYPRSPEWWECK